MIVGCRLSNPTRRKQIAAGWLDYPRAIAQELPTGSGEIESAHRYIVQRRLKRPGAWWRMDHAEHMLALRLNRANKQWQSYWATDFKRVA